MRFVGDADVNDGREYVRWYLWHCSSASDRPNECVACFEPVLRFYRDASTNQGTNGRTNDRDRVKQRKRKTERETRIRLDRRNFAVWWINDLDGLQNTTDFGAVSCRCARVFQIIQPRMSGSGDAINGDKVVRKWEGEDRGTCPGQIDRLVRTMHWNITRSCVLRLCNYSEGRQSVIGKRYLATLCELRLTRSSSFRGTFTVTSCKWLSVFDDTVWLFSLQ